MQTNYYKVLITGADTGLKIHPDKHGKSEKYSGTEPVPAPKKITVGGQVFEIPEILRVYYNNHEELKPIIGTFFDEWTLFHKKNLPEVELNARENIDYPDGKVSEPPRDPEGYLLKIDEKGIFLISNGVSGIFYGLWMFYKILYPSEEGYTVVKCEIEDYPDMKIRGLSDDISRGQVCTVENAEKFIRILASYGLNTYMFYIEDTFRFDRYPKIGAERGALTHEEVKRLKDYAERHCVKLIPIFQTLGHMETYFLTPDFIEYAEFRGSSCLNPANPESYDFLSHLLEEVYSVFQPEYFHIGCDETWDIGKKGSKQLLEEIGAGNLYLKHYKWCIEKLLSLGVKKIFLYSDVAAKYKEVLTGLPKENVIFVVWDYGYKKHYKRMDPVIEWKLPFVVSSSALNWRKIFPDIRESLRTNRRLIEEGLKYGAIGQICSSWGDNGNEDLRENRLYAFAAASSMSWNFDGFSEESFNRSFFLRVLGIYNEEVSRMWDLIGKLHEEMRSDVFSDFQGHFWRHPFARETLGDEIFDPAAEEYSEDFMEDKIAYLREIIDLAAKIGDTVRNGPDEVVYSDYIKYAADAVLLLIEKIRTSKKIEKITHKPEHKYLNRSFSSEELSEAEQLLGYIKNRYRELGETYRRLWTACAKEPRLPQIMEYFDRMCDWYDIKLEEMKKGIYFKSPMLPGCWIAYPEGGVKTEKDRYFYKEFALNEDEFRNIDFISVLFIPLTYGILKINDEFVAEAPVIYNSTGLYMDHRHYFGRIDKNKLKAGTNRIAVTVRMEPSGIPFFHFTLYIQFTDGRRSMVIFSDPTWKAAASPNGPYVKAERKGVPPFYMGEVYTPDFLKNKPPRYSLSGFGRIVKTIIGNPGPFTRLFERMVGEDFPFY